MERKFFIRASRLPGPYMEPIIFEGKRYEQLDNGVLVGLTQRTGLMGIYDDASNTNLAYVSIYDELRNPIMEADAGDVFFTRFELDEAKREIYIKNERHRQFIYSIDSGAVREIKDGEK